MIHGDSAGGGSIAFHLTAYGGRKDNKLFVGAISESPFLPTHRTVAESEFQFDKFAAQVGCSGKSNTMSCLRSLTTAQLQSADVVSPFPGAPSSVEPDWYFLPVVDGTLSPDILYKLFEQGRMVRVPAIVGDDTDEGTDFSPNAASSTDFVNFVKANYPHLNSWELLLVQHAYPLAGSTQFPNHTPWFTPAEMAYGEATFICPGIEISQAVSQWTGPSKSWNYRYNVADKGLVAAGLGVPHVSEKPAIFGPNMAGACGTSCSYETYNAPIVPVVMNYWISFVRSLNPNTHKYKSAPEWQPWAGGRRLKFELGKTGMESVPRSQSLRCAMWKALAPVSEQ